MNLLPTGLVVLTLFAALPAQATHIVTNGDLEAAVKAAKPGDILIVKRFVLTPSVGPLVIDKPLFIYGRDAGMLFSSGNVVIKSIPRGSAVTFSGFTQTRSVQVFNCAGQVLLANLRSVGPVIQDCADVTIAESSMGEVRIKNSRVAISQTKLAGMRFSSRFPMHRGSYGLRAEKSTRRRARPDDVSVSAGRAGTAAAAARTDIPRRTRTRGQPA